MFESSSKSRKGWNGLCIATFFRKTSDSYSLAYITNKFMKNEGSPKIERFPDKSDRIHFIFMSYATIM